MRKVAFWLSLLLLFTVPWENSVIIGNLGRVSRVMGLFVAAFWFGTVLATGKIRQLRPFHLLIFLYFFWSGTSVLWSIDQNATLNRILTYVQLIGFSWLLWDLYTTQSAVRAGLQAIVFGSYVSAIDTVSNYLAGISRGSTPRYAASGFNANGLAMILVLGLPIAWYLAVSASRTEDKLSKILKVVNYAYIPLAVFAILGTGSRTALISMVPVFWFIIGGSTRLRVVEGFFASLFLAGALFFLQPIIPQTSIERLSTTKSELTEGDLSGRRLIWAAAMEVFQERPLLGSGGGSFKTAVDYKGKAPHNTYLGILVETGAIGLTLFIIIIAASIYHVRYQPRWEATLWLTLILVWAVSGTTLSWELKKHTWLFLNMVVIYAAIFRESAIKRDKIPSSRKQPVALGTD